MLTAFPNPQPNPSPIFNWLCSTASFPFISTQPMSLCNREDSNLHRALVVECTLSSSLIEKHATGEPYANTGSVYRHAPVSQRLLIAAREISSHIG